MIVSIGLDDTAQWLAFRVDHGSAQLGTQHPGGSVRAKAELALQLQSAPISNANPAAAA
jgi:hypothetical protein